MKTIVFTICMMTGMVFCYAQGDAHYQPIDEVGWELSNFSPPENLTENDIGKVNYLLILDTKGQLKDVKILSNTFSKKNERLWRRQVKKLIFSRDFSDKTIKSKGTFLIERQRCSDEDSSEDKMDQ